jgi:hypothetical protein
MVQTVRMMTDAEKEEKVDVQDCGCCPMVVERQPWVGEKDEDEDV